MLTEDVTSEFRDDGSRGCMNACPVVRALCSDGARRLVKPCPFSSSPSLPGALLSVPKFRRVSWLVAWCLPVLQAPLC